MLALSALRREHGGAGGRAAPPTSGSPSPTSRARRASPPRRSSAAATPTGTCWRRRAAASALIDVDKRRLARRLPRERHHPRRLPEGSPSRPSHLYRNKGDGTFEDVTERAGLVQHGWGQGVCVGDYDNDGFDDLYVTYWGQNRLYRNRGDGTFEDVTDDAPGSRDRATRWGAGLRLPRLRPRRPPRPLRRELHRHGPRASTPVPDSGLCRYKGMPVACGPPGLHGGQATSSTATRATAPSRTSRSARASPQPSGTYGLGVTTLRLRRRRLDGPLRGRTTPARARLYRNNRDGTFTDVAVRAGCAYSQDGKPQAGMGIAVGDYDRNGTMDLVKTNFAGDTSTLYANTRRRASARTGRSPPASAATRGSSGGASGSSTSTPTGGSTSSSSTATSIRRSRSSRPRRATSSARWSTGTSATAASRTSASGSAPPVTDTQGGPRRGLRRHRQRRRRRRRRQQRERRARPLPAGPRGRRRIGSP